MTLALQALIAFTALFITDICWALYVRRVKDGNAIMSSLWAVVLFLSGAVAVISYTTNPLLLIPAACGACLGTYVAVKWDTRSTSH